MTDVFSVFLNKDDDDDEQVKLWIKSLNVVFTWKYRVYSYQKSSLEFLAQQFQRFYPY